MRVESLSTSLCAWYTLGTWLAKPRAALEGRNDLIVITQIEGVSWTCVEAGIYVYPVTAQTLPFAVCHVGSKVASCL